MEKGDGREVCGKAYCGECKDKWKGDLEQYTARCVDCANKEEKMQSENNKRKKKVLNLQSDIGGPIAKDIVVNEDIQKITGNLPSECSSKKSSKRVETPTGKSNVSRKNKNVVSKNTGGKGAVSKVVGINRRETRNQTRSVKRGGSKVGNQKIVGSNQIKPRRNVTQGRRSKSK